MLGVLVKMEFINQRSRFLRYLMVLCGKYATRGRPETRNGFLVGLLLEKMLRLLKSIVSVNHFNSESRRCIYTKCNIP